jgi:hypothetical protein
LGHNEKFLQLLEVTSLLRFKEGPLFNNIRARAGANQVPQSAWRLPNLKVQCLAKILTFMMLNMS